MSEKTRKQQITELETIARRILVNKRSSRPKRPLLIEFCGSPKAGKTTCLGGLDLFLRRNGFKVRKIAEKAETCTIRDKSSYMFNTWTLTQAVSELAAIAADDRTSDVVLIDRGLFDSLTWFELFRMREAILEDDYKAVTSLARIPSLRRSVDLVVSLEADPDISVHREFAGLLTDTPGSIMNPGFLREYLDALESAHQQFGTDFKYILRVDTSETEQLQLSYEVTMQVLTILDQQVQEQICFVPKEVSGLELGGAEVEAMGFGAFDWPLASLHYAPRTEVEVDRSRLQVVAVAVLTNVEQSQVAVVRKSAKGLGELGPRGHTVSPEKDRNLCYLGGHVRREDSFDLGENPSFLALARRALEREISEEIRVTLDFSGIEPFVIYDRTSEKSKQHLAVCFVKRLTHLNSLRPRADEYEFSSTSRWFELRDPSSVASEPATLENWSVAILRHVFGVVVSEATPRLDLEY